MNGRYAGDAGCVHDVVGEGRADQVGSTRLAQARLRLGVRVDDDDRDGPSLQFLDHRVARIAHAGDFGFDLVGAHEVVRYVHAAGRHQHGAPDGYASGHSQSVDGECHLTRLRRTCR